VPRHFGIDDAMQALGRGRHQEVKRGLALVGSTPDGLHEGEVRGGAIGDE
jgi:hypothetical protein